jgi:hypothetical protein
MIFKHRSTCGITAMINTVKMEARAGLLQATTRSNDGKALRHGPALEALQTEIWVLEDLAGDRMEQIGGGRDRTRASRSGLRCSGHSEWAVHRKEAIAEQNTKTVLYSRQ